MNDGIILGLDGLDFSQLTEYREDLPVLDSLFQEGAWGELRSTIPPTTAAAWTTALSGMSPARTGITDFGVSTDGHENGENVVDSTDVKTPRIWDVVEANGGRSAVIGVPVTYPATRIDGLMISGFLSRSTECGHVHPPELTAELPDDYRFFIPYSDYNSSEELLEEIYASTDAKFDLLEQVLQGELPGTENHLDLVCFVLSEPDWIQHYFLRQPDEPDAEYGREVVREYLKHVDEKVGNILSLVDDRTIGLLSDHGFGKCSSHHVFVNEWLSQEGYLILEESDGPGGRWRRIAGRRIRDIARIPGFRQIKRLIPKSAKQAAIDLSTLREEDIDWEKTQAVFRKKFSNTGFVEINQERVSNDDVDALIEELLAGIRDLSDPETGDDVVEEIHRCEDYYSGPFVDSLPEIVFVFEEPYTGNEQVGGNIVKELPPGGRPNPAHRMGGFFCITGPGIHGEKRVDADIHQFTPSLYRTIDLPLPDTLDGEPLSELDYQENYPRSQTITYDPEFVVDGVSGSDVEQRLSDLGYI